MTLAYAKHKNILFQILKDIYSQTSLAPYLGFKGGTAALLFYGLDRNSVDLDFDLLDEEKEQFVFGSLQKIVSSYGKIIESRKKRFNLIHIISYEPDVQNIKIEVNLRKFGSRYELKELLGIPLPVMAKADMFAHKLMAMHERIGKTSRDIYDVWFFLKNNWPINNKIVEKRSGRSLSEFLKTAVKQLEDLNNRKILVGLGEFLKQSQRDWAKEKLRSETIFLLKARLESER
ncbi:MAG: nucleotidyl transferase AbiEii/AbiGii toxin family protein [Patescibacteria group bacterium]